ncbi:MAG: TetR/AcrR family transcriptional regulator [Candidatus Acidiferrales bacterium]|jgi:TetR/AcrR family transcriptional regulator, transcriptional repressor for nem operon
MDNSSATTRDRLVNSAVFLFWDRGFAGTSMSDLLAHSDVNSGSFYHFFESKEALLREVLDWYIRGLRPYIAEPAFQVSDEPIARIFAILAGYRERILQTNFRYGCPIGRLALEIDPENQPAHQLIAQNFKNWVGVVRECLDQVAHRMPKGTDLDALATYVLAIMEGGVMLSRSYGSVEPFDRAVSQLREHFRLLAAPASKLASRPGRSGSKKRTARR